MNEAEWLVCTDAALMLDFLSRHGRVTERKAVRYGLAVCRRNCVVVTDPDDPESNVSPERLESMQEYAQGLLMAELASEEEMAVSPASEEAESWLAEIVAPSWGEPSEERAARAALVREVFGNPFRPASLAPSCRTPTVQSLAQSAYEERQLPAGLLDCDRLAVLADALEDLGSATELVEHLRGPGPHVRGCWAVDLCLGKS